MAFLIFAGSVWGSISANWAEKNVNTAVDFQRAESTN
jgi:hypothetical protein